VRRARLHGLHHLRLGIDLQGAELVLLAVPVSKRVAWDGLCWLRGGWGM
jgi:hypothetical protein